MKYLAILIVLVSAALAAQAQTSNPSAYTYRQKQLNDRLKMLFPDLQTSDEVLPYSNVTPVLPLKNDGVKTGINEKGEVYSMQTDNMPLLKPFKIKDEIPDAISLKQPLPLLPKSAH